MMCYFCNREIDRGYWISLDSKTASCEAMVCKLCWQTGRNAL